MKLSTTVILSAAALALGASPASAANIVLDLLQNLSVITGDYTAGNETEGSALVHGNYLPQGSSARFGFNGGAAADDRENMLWLNNGVANGNGTTLLTGSVVSRVTVSSSQFNLNGNAPNTPSIKQGAGEWNTALQGLGVTDVQELTDTLAAASLYWSQLDGNSTGSTPGNGSYTFNASPVDIDGHLVAVFNVDASAIFGAGGFDRLDLNFNGAETILINVSGTDITVEKNFSNGFQNNESRILFNFHEATSLTINRNFRGGIYAPLADVVQGGSNFDGSVVAASIVQTAEIHDERFDGYLPFEPIPEPSVALLLLTGTGFLTRRRR